MALYDLVDRFRQPSLWLREQQWAQWALPTIAVSLSFLLLALLARRRRKATTRAAFADNSLEGSLADDVGLAGAELTNRDFDDPITAGATRTDLRQQNPVHATAPVDWPEESIRHLRREIIKRDQTEARLEQEVDKLRAVNAQLRQRLSEAKQISASLEQKIAELTAADEHSRNQAPEAEAPAPEETEPEHKDQPRVSAEPEQKLCRKCKQQKARSEFHKNASSNDGLARWCKECKTKAARESRQRRSSVRHNAMQRAGICADAPLCVLHHRQADRLKRARRRRPRSAEQAGTRTRKFRSPLSSPGLHCPKK